MSWHAADNRIGLFKFDLDSMRPQLAAYGGFVPLDDAQFLAKSGVAVQEQRRHVDPATIARLLVFAD